MQGKTRLVSLTPLSKAYRIEVPFVITSLAYFSRSARNKVQAKAAQKEGLGTDLIPSGGSAVKPEAAANFGVPEISSAEVSFDESDILGEGAYGKVYLGTCRGQQVAVKVLKRNLEPKVIAEFKSEVKLLSQIFHPNVCLFMGACFEEGSMMIITELLPLGDMQGLLYNKKFKLSLFTRMRMALDAAQGMCWLHFGKQVVIHRDLKPGNFLVDENMRVKVCDFGLSQLISNEQLNGEETLRDPKGRIKGSPLWMAPEVLKGESFNAKADVYAFGIVLWEIIARKKPYSHIKTLAQLRREVCVQHVRPPTPKEIPESLEKLLADTTAPVAANRPDFKMIVDRMENILIDIAISDPEGRTFWRANFKGSVQAHWTEFQEKFDAFLGENGDDVDEDVQELNSACLRAILELPPADTSSSVHVEVFGKILFWIGPLKDGTFYSRLCHLLNQVWFHGALSTSDAERVLEGRAAGSFLVRFSSRSPGSYTISKLQEDGKKTHQRVDHKKNGYRINHHTYPTLDKLLEGEYAALKLLHSCPGSKYKEIFESSDSGNNYTYQEQSDSEE